LLAVAVKWRKSVQNTINFISKCRQMLVSGLNWFLTTYFKMFLVAIGTKIQLE